MLLASIILYIISTAVNMRRDKTIVYAKISMLLLSILFLLGYSSCYMTLLKDPGLQGGLLLYISSISHYFQLFILLLAFSIAVLAVFYPREVKAFYPREVEAFYTRESLVFYFRIIFFTLILILFFYLNFINISIEFLLLMYSGLLIYYLTYMDDYLYKNNPKLYYIIITVLLIIFMFCLFKIVIYSFNHFQFFVEYYKTIYGQKIYSSCGYPKPKGNKYGKHNSKASTYNTNQHNDTGKPGEASTGNFNRPILTEEDFKGNSSRFDLISEDIKVMKKNVEKLEELKKNGEYITNWENIYINNTKKKIVDMLERQEMRIKYRMSLDFILNDPEKSPPKSGSEYNRFRHNTVLEVNKYLHLLNLRDSKGKIIQYHKKTPIKTIITELTSLVDDPKYFSRIKKTKHLIEYLEKMYRNNK